MGMSYSFARETSKKRIMDLVHWLTTLIILLYLGRSTCREGSYMEGTVNPNYWRAGGFKLEISLIGAGKMGECFYPTSSRQRA